MKWHYSCPLCGAWISVKWAEKDSRFQCPICHRPHWPPSPSVQRDAYVNDRTPPVEMAEDVYRLKGHACTVPRCQNDGDTLDHRIPWEHYKKGTCVDNLFPMCSEHNSSKGEKDYFDWLRELDQR